MMRLHIALDGHTVTIGRIVGQGVETTLCGDVGGEDHQLGIIPRGHDHFFTPIAQDVTVEHGDTAVATCGAFKVPGGQDAPDTGGLIIPLLDLTVIEALAQVVIVPP